MSAAPHGIYVATTASTVYVRVVDRGTSRNSECLRDYVRKHLAEGHRQVVIDLQLCEGLDSTFLGVLAGFALALRTTGTLALLNLSSECRRPLVELGVNQIPSVRIVPVDDVTFELPALEVFEPLRGSELHQRHRALNPVEEALLILECHECLCHADEKNKAKFREVKEFLREDIERHGGVAPPAH